MWLQNPGNIKVLYKPLNYRGLRESARRSELYVAETYYTRGTLGERTDVLTIYEKENLLPIAEVVLPGKKRALMLPHKGQVQLTNNEQFALIFNFTPAASVTVVDIDKKAGRE